MSVRRALPRARLWLAVAGVLVVAAALVVLIRPGSGRALDPGSPDPGGSKALASALSGYGVQVHKTSDPARARGQIVVVEPAAYTAGQIRQLASRGNLVLFGPAGGALLALGTPAHPLSTIAGRTAPGCSWPGAAAAGAVELPADTLVYTAPGVQSCYGGGVLRGDGWTWLGSRRLLRNDTVADTGVAALDVNAITADRTRGEVELADAGDGRSREGRADDLGAVSRWRPARVHLARRGRGAAGALACTAPRPGGDRAAAGRGALRRGRRRSRPVVPSGVRRATVLRRCCARGRRAD